MAVKTLFFIEKFGGGGAEKVLRDLVNHMDQSKFEITVQSVWPYPEGKRLRSGIRYRSVYPVRNRLTEQLYRLEAALGWTYPLHIRDHYDIECAYLEFGPTKILAASNNRKALKLAWIHCDIENAAVSRETVEKKCGKWYERYDQVVCVSSKVKEGFDRIFHGRFPSVVVRNFFDSANVVSRSMEPAPAQKPAGKLLLLAVGSLYPPKNYPRLLRAIQRLLADGLPVELWILGDGEDRGSLEQYVSENNLTGSVRFWGFQQNPYPFYRLADVLVCSSNYEGFSTVISEGLLLEKAIVTTECSGMRDLLGDSEYGIITENDDEAFYLGLRSMLGDPGRISHYQRQAAARGARLIEELSVENTERFLETSLQEKRNRTTDRPQKQQ